MDGAFNTLSIVYLVTLLLLLATVAARNVAAVHRAVIGQALGSTARLLLGLGLFAVVLYAAAYFLSLVGGFYESLTCKVVTLPACEDPLALPAWLRLPPQSVGGVIGILPLLGIFLAKSMQGEKRESPPVEGSFWQRAFGGVTGAVAANLGVIAILFIELWLAWLRGAAEAADRQVRLSLGLDADLPAAYLGVAQWGAVVLALGLSAVVYYLGVGGRFGLNTANQGFTGLGRGAGFVNLVGAVLTVLASGLIAAWTTVAIGIGRLALKVQSAVTRLYVLVVTASGRGLLKLYSGAQRVWVFAAQLVGFTVLFIGSVPRRIAAAFANRRPSGMLVLALVAAGVGSHYATAATTYVVLQDVSGGEAARLETANQMLLRIADPSPQLSLLQRHDRLVVIPVHAPGELDTVYSALFNAAYPSSQLDRYAFFAELKNVLPTDVDETWGTGLSESLRSAAVYLAEAPPEDERVLVIFGNGEDHSSQPVAAEELMPAVRGALVILLNSGLEERAYWRELFTQAGAATVLAYDQAATRLLSVQELAAAMARARGQ
jgi:hypothetical protein